MVGKLKRTLLLLTTAVLFCGCGALQPPNATGPRNNEALYPITLNEDSQREDATLAALNRLAQLPGNSTNAAATLQPITGTILSLPPAARTTLYLPKLGAGPVMTEEETRESLRRFIRLWQELIGSDPLKLSLVERIDQPDGTKIAKYEQRPFRYPIRGPYGKLQITFTSDRHILDLNSTCIPDADRIQTAFSNLTFSRKSEDAITQLRAKGVSYVDSKGAQTNFSIPPSTAVTAHGLTTYIQPAKDLKALDFHIAWEIELTNAPVKLVYVDALTGDVIAVA
ncbi:MAG TPA: hypothetical protein VLL54_09755 [Pyrinomonadaceae bacterium]|nr:hypothetical protein [Pyrinomonadaceae bacterium]